MRVPVVFRVILASGIIVMGCAAAVRSAAGLANQNTGGVAPSVRYLNL
jgi:hypothetical protein